MSRNYIVRPDDGRLRPKVGAGRPRSQGCGTEAGYQWHRRHAQRPCLPCYDAVNEANARRKSQRAA